MPIPSLRDRLSGTDPFDYGRDAIRKVFDPDDPGVPANPQAPKDAPKTPSPNNPAPSLIPDSAVKWVTEEMPSRVGAFLREWWPLLLVAAAVYLAVRASRVTIAVARKRGR